MMTFEELAQMLAKRDGIDFEDELTAINFAADEIETAFYNGDLGLAEDILKTSLSLEPDYLDIFIN